MDIALLSLFCFSAIHDMYRLLSLVVLLSSLFLASCSKYGIDEEPEANAKTIFVFMPYSGDANNLYPDFIRNLDDMQKAMVAEKGLEGNRLLVFLSTSATRSVLFEMRYERDICIADTLHRYASPDYTSAEGLASILREVQTVAPARQYAMIVGCHGEGWLPKKGGNYSATRFFGGSSVKYQIDITDFASAISAAGMHMQFILFDDCYLSCVEVAYDLRSVTDYLIASTSEIMAYGMPYEKILPHLLGNTPDYGAVCSDFLDFYGNYRSPYGTIGVTDCRVADRVAARMRQLNAAFRADEVEPDSVQDLDAGHWEPTIYFDFGDYVRRLCADDTVAYSSFLELLNEFVPYKASTRQIMSWSRYRIIDVDAFSGIAVSDLSVNTRAVETKKNTSWWRATH